MSDDLTPAPILGETLEGYYRRITQAMTPAHIDAEKSRFNVSLIRAFFIAGGLLVGGVTAGMSYRDLTSAVSTMRAQLGELQTVAAKLEARLPDVRADAAKEAARALRVRMHGARIRLRCESRARPDGQRDCEMAWPVNDGGD